MLLILRFLFLAALILELAGCQATPEKKEGLSAVQIEAIKAEGFVESEEGWELSTPEKLLFASSEFKLEASARQSVARIAQLLVRLGILRVRVDGHADSSGTLSFNEQLSLRRAQAVAEALVDNGMSSHGVQVRGLGSRIPLVSNQSPEGRSQNRRVVLVIPVH